MKKYIKVLLFVAVILSISSCLKDEGYENNLYGVNESLENNKVINIPTAGSSLNVSRTYPLAANPANTPVTITIPVHLSAKDPANESLSVTLAPDATDTKITMYNNSITTLPKFIRMPANTYTLSNGGVATIGQGSKDGSITLTFTPSNLTSGVRYALPISIQSVDKSGYIISGNQGYRMFLFTINY